MKACENVCLASQHLDSSDLFLLNHGKLPLSLSHQVLYQLIVLFVYLTVPAVRDILFVHPSLFATSGQSAVCTSRTLFWQNSQLGQPANLCLERCAAQCDTTTALASATTTHSRGHTQFGTIACHSTRSNTYLQP